MQKYSSNLWFLLLERGGSSAPTVKQEAATAVVELLMMGVRMPETSWAVNKCQVIN